MILQRAKQRYIYFYGIKLLLVLLALRRARGVSVLLDLPLLVGVDGGSISSSAVSEIRRRVSRKTTGKFSLSG